MTISIEIQEFWIKWNALLVDLKDTKEALDRGGASRFSMAELQWRGTLLIGEAQANLERQSVPDQAYVLLIELQDTLHSFDPARGVKAQE